MSNYPSPVFGLRSLVLAHYLTFFPTSHRPRATEFFNGVWPKWFFSALRLGNINPITFQVDNYDDIIDPNHTDISYLSKKIKYIITTTNARVPPIVPIPIHIHELSPLQISRALSIYTGPRNNFNDDVRRLQSYYAGLEGGAKTASNTNFLSIPPSLIELALAPHKFTHVHELFGSPFNTWAHTYSSAFQMEVDLFSSRGSFHRFFNNATTTDLLIVNPPFDESIILEAANLVIKMINNFPRMIVIFVIPDWPEEGFPARQKLRWASQSHAVSASPQHSKFFNYGTGVLVPASAAVLFILSCTPPPPTITAQHIIDVWRNKF